MVRAGFRLTALGSPKREAALLIVIVGIIGRNGNLPEAGSVFKYGVRYGAAWPFRAGRRSVEAALRVDCSRSVVTVRR